MTDYLGIALADEEHRQGRPYTADPQHCETCAEVDLAWTQATCPHNGELIDVTSLDDLFLQRLCNTCGDIIEVPR
jgi:hypothetical protein